MAANARWVILQPKLARVVWWNMAVPEVKEIPEGAILIPVTNAMIFQTEVADRLLELHPNEEAAGFYFDTYGGVRRWGIRSRNGFDCHALARGYGGGGYKHEGWFIERP